MTGGASTPTITCIKHVPEVAVATVLSTHITGEIEMNRDQVKGRAKEVAGKVENNAGRAAGSVRTEAKGLAREAAGKVQKAVGDARNASDKNR